MQPVRSSRIWLYSFLYSPTCQKNVFQCVLDYFMLQNRFNLGMFFWTRYGFPARFNWIYKKSEHRYSLILFAQVENLFLSKLWNKKWGSLCRVEDVRTVRTTFCPLFHFWVRTGASFYEIPVETLDRRSNVHGRNHRKSDIFDISL